MISIIIPIYNAEETITMTVDSVINQSYKNTQIILVNDGSTDNTLEVIEENYGHLSNIIIVNQSNRGVSSARNEGIRHATGNYLGFVDSDDIIESDMYFNMHKNINENCTDISFTNIIVHDVNGDIHYEKRIQEDKITNSNIRKKILPRLLSGSSLDNNEDIIKGSVCRILVRVDFYKKNTVMFNEDIKYMEDLVFLFELVCKCNSISFTKSYDYRYIHRANSTVMKFNSNLLENIIASEEKLLKIIYKLDLESHLKDRLELRKINLIKTLLINLMNNKEKKSLRIDVNKAKSIINSDVLRVENFSSMTKNISFGNKIFVTLIRYNQYFLLYLMYTMKK